MDGATLRDAVLESWEAKITLRHTPLVRRTSWFDDAAQHDEDEDDCMTTVMMIMRRRIMLLMRYPIWQYAQDRYQVDLRRS
jgi:hypothetical protein